MGLAPSAFLGILKMQMHGFVGKIFRPCRIFSRYLGCWKLMYTSLSIAGFNWSEALQRCQWTSIMHSCWLRVFGGLETQSTNKRAKKVACFISTNTRTYILYKLFGLIFTIKYILQSKNPSKHHMYSFLRDLWATWPISKSETPQGFQGTLSKMRYLRHVFYVSFIQFLAVPLVHHVCSPAVYMFLFLLSQFVMHLLYPKEATGRSCHIYLTPPCLVLSFHAWLLSLDLALDQNHWQSSTTASIF